MVSRIIVTLIPAAWIARTGREAPASVAQRQMIRGVLEPHAADRLQSLEVVVETVREDPHRNGPGTTPLEQRLRARIQVDGLQESVERVEEIRVSLVVHVALDTASGLVRRLTLDTWAERSRLLP